jgi:hypothetical protein
MAELFIDSPFNCDCLERQSDPRGSLYSLMRMHENVSCMAVVTENVLTEPLASNGLFRVYSLQQERAYRNVG